MCQTEPEINVIRPNLCQINFLIFQEFKGKCQDIRMNEALKALKMNKNNKVAPEQLNNELKLTTKFCKEGELQT